MNAYVVEPGGDERAETSLLTELGRAIMAARLDLRLSQRELADRAGVSVSTISRIEGAKFNPTVTVLAAIATALGRSMDALAGLKPPAAPGDHPLSLEARFDALAAIVTAGLEEAAKSRARFSQLVEILATEPELPERLRARLRLVTHPQAS